MSGKNLVNSTKPFLMSPSNSFIQEILKDDSILYPSINNNSNNNSNNNVYQNNDHISHSTTGLTYKQQEVLIDKLQKTIFELQMQKNMLESHLEKERAAFQEKLLQLEAPQKKKVSISRATQTLNSSSSCCCCNDSGNGSNNSSNNSHSHSGGGKTLDKLLDTQLNKLSTGVNTSFFYEESLEAINENLLTLLQKVHAQVEEMNEGQSTSQSKSHSKRTPVTSIDQLYSSIVSNLSQFKQEQLTQQQTLLENYKKEQQKVESLTILLNESQSKLAALNERDSSRSRYHSNKNYTEDNNHKQLGRYTHSPFHGFTESQLREITSLAAACGAAASIASVNYNSQLGHEPLYDTNTVIELERLRKEVNLLFLLFVNLFNFLQLI